MLALAAVCLGASGCTSFSTYQPSARAPAPTAPDPATSGPPGYAIPDDGAATPQGQAALPVAAEPRSSQPKVVRQENAASAVLIAQSRDERAAGSYADATASIERALRIDPNNPALWIELAEIKAAGGDWDQAEMMARKALTLAGSDQSIMARADRLVR